MTNVLKLALLVGISLMLTTYRDTKAQLLPKKPVKPINLNLPPLNGGGKGPFSWSGKGLSGKNGVNGFSLTGKWSPPGTGHSFSGTGSWQNGKGFGGSLKGSFGIGGGSSISVGFGGGGGKVFKASLGLKFKLRKRRGLLRQ